MFQLSTSLREEKPLSTYLKAENFGNQLGITRVSEITKLDRIGIPVYACIRPYAHRSSLSVHAGKGLKKEDAKISALMEGIEFAVAEHSRTKIPILQKTPSELFGENSSAEILDYCPMYGKPVPIDKSISWVEVEGLYGSENFFAPADLIFHPLPDIKDYTTYFGSSTNGLASGNSYDEATVHGLLEVIERDVESFRLAYDQSFLVSLNTLPKKITPIISLFNKANLRLCIRYVPNVFGLPYFAAFALEKHESFPIFAAEGFGCHPIKEIALTRAITEAAQSRLSHIHGGRDDVIDRYLLFREGEDNSKELSHNREFEKKVLSGQAIEYQEIVDSKTHFKDTSDMTNWLCSILKVTGFSKMGRVLLTSPNDPVSVVRVVVPKLEALNSITKRVGVRLANYVSEHLTPPIK